MTLTRTLTHRTVDENGKLNGFVTDETTKMPLEICVAEAESGIIYELHNPITGAEAATHTVTADFLRSNPDDSLDNNINSLPIWSD